MLQNARRLAIGGLGLSGALISYKLASDQRAERATLLKKLSENSAKPTVEVKNAEVFDFPWHEPFYQFEQAENWEFRRVKITGRLTKTTQLVYREKAGQPGYFVFKALETARLYGPNTGNSPSETNVPYRAGIMVNVGWVPASKMGQLGLAEVGFLKAPKANEDLPYLFPQAKDPFTGAVYNSVSEEDLTFDLEGFGREEVEVVGYLRRGEKPGFFSGKKRWGNLLTSFVDLEKMAAFYGISNAESAREYYLQVGLPKLTKKVQEGNLVQPVSFAEAKGDVEGYIKDLNRAEPYKMLGALSVLGALSALII